MFSDAPDMLRLRRSCARAHTHTHTSTHGRTYAYPPTCSNPPAHPPEDGHRHPTPPHPTPPGLAPPTAGSEKAGEGGSWPSSSAKALDSRSMAYTVHVRRAAAQEEVSSSCGCTCTVCSPHACGSRVLSTCKLEAAACFREDASSSCLVSARRFAASSDGLSMSDKRSDRIGKVNSCV